MTAPGGQKADSDKRIAGNRPTPQSLCPPVSLSHYLTVPLSHHPPIPHIKKQRSLRFHCFNFYT